MKRRAMGAVAIGAMVAGSLLTGGVADARQPGHQVLATGLDNPRGLNWSDDGNGLIIAQAGSGGSMCFDAGEGPEGGTQCVGATGKVGVIRNPWNKIRVAPQPLASGLISIAGPDGTFATGADAADRTNVPGETITAITGAPPSLRPPGLPADLAAQIGTLLVTEQDPSTGEMFNFPYTDFQTLEENRNPDHAQIDSNPYGILFVNSKAGDGSGYALVADAAANTVWKVDPDLSICGDDEECVPPQKVTVFHKWVPPSAPTTVDKPDIEYVPTSLASDRHGNIYVGGLGSLEPGKAKVTKFSATGKKMVTWKGFTSVTGVAFRHGSLYVSQLFGGATGDPFAPGAAPAGQLTKIGANGVPHTRSVPFPAGVAVDRYDNVYVAVNSVLPSGFRPGDTTRPSAHGGAIWRLRF